MSASQEQRAALRVEVFRTTGISMDEDDPIILCALMQSKLMRDAATDASLHLEQSLGASLEAIEKTIETKTNEMADKVARHIMSSVQEKAEVEANRLTRQMTRVAAELRDRLNASRDFESEAPRWGLRAVIMVAVAITVSSLMAAYMFAEKLTLAERRDLQYSQQVKQAYPYLDKKTQKALDDAIATAGKSK